MSLVISSIKKEYTYRTNVEMEYALLHLMYQFRQMNNKYGLMVDEQIDELYEQRQAEMNHYQHYVDHLEKEPSK